MTATPKLALNQRARPWTELLTAAGFCAFLFYFGLGSFGLVGADEPRYAQIAREMLARHDWITPVLNGAPWLEKPVLYYWRAMVAYSAFGVSDWAARLPSAAVSTLVVAVVYFFMRRFRPGSQLDAALITASTAWIVGFSRAASTDMHLASSFTIAMLAWFAWHGTGRKLWLAFTWIFIGLGILAKGPVALVLAGLVVLSVAALKRDLRLVLRTFWLPGIVLFCAVALPWYIAVQLRNPEFFRVFILQHNLARFESNLFRHPQPFWYFLPIALLGLLPWTVLAVASAVEAVSGWLRKSESTAESDLPLFLLVWLLVPIVFFSFSQSKLPGYILPAIPAGALLACEYLHRKLTGGEQPLGWIVALHCAAAAFLLSAVLLAQYWIVRLRPTGQAILTAAAVGVVVFGGMLLTVRLQGLRLLRFVTLVPVILALGFILRVSAPVLDSVDSARPVAREIERLDPRRSPLAGFHIPRETEYGLNFYRNQPVRRYERAEIPPMDHLLVAGAGAEDELKRLLEGRRISHVGGFGPQHLEFYWISTPPPMHHHH